MKWDPDRGAELRTTTGRITRIRIKWNKSDRLPCPRKPAQLRPRQPKARRVRQASRAASDGNRSEDPDPEPPDKQNAARRRSLAAHVSRSISHKTQRDDDRRTIGKFALSCNTVVALPLRDGAICLA